MPKQTPLKGTSRQRPVSCRFCRSRKLRCSRESPCSNCVSRGIQCELETIAAADPEQQVSSKSELLERIRKLEDLVGKFNHPSPQTIITETVSESSSECTQPAPDTVLSPHIEHLDSDAAWLESIYDGPDRSPDELSPEQVGFKICSISQVAQPQHSSRPELQCNPSLTPPWRFWLPQYFEARILLDKFIQDIEYLHHVVHTPSLPAVVDRVYSCLSEQGRVKSGDIILMLSIFASATQSWSPFDCRRHGLFTNSTEANRQSKLWAEATEDLLNVAQRTTRVSLEGIQGAIIAMFTMVNIEGFSRRCRYLIATGVTLARELGLHFIDHPSEAEHAHTLQAEMGRRVWWYLVSSDWSTAARFNGNSRGVYWTHPRHMMTHKPQNLDDEDIMDGFTRVGRPISQPTVMTYFLLRIRLSEICRSVTDRTPLLEQLTRGPSHEVVTDIDTELQQLINETPPFFSMSVADIMKTYSVCKIRAVQLARHGILYFSLVHSQRCKLHLPFLRLGFTDKTYATSRDVCIQSARYIIRTKINIESTGLCAALRLKPLGLVMSVFMACIVLLMDMCLTKSSSPHQKTVSNSNSSDIIHAFRMLHDARSESEMAAQFLDSMLHVLNKHGLSIPKGAIPPPRPPTSELANASPMAVTAFGSDGDYNSLITPMTSLNGQMADGPECGLPSEGFLNGENGDIFGDLAQSFEQGFDVGNINWDDIFVGLDTFV